MAQGASGSQARAENQPGNTGYASDSIRANSHMTSDKNRMPTSG